MSFCPSCGAARPEGAAFCVGCGAALAPAPQAVTAQSSTGPVPAAAGFDARRLLVGNWVAAAATVVAALGVAVLFSLALAFLGDADDVGLWDTSVLGVAGATNAFTVDATGSVDLAEGDLSGTLGVAPLVVTTVSLAAAVWVFRRLTRATTSLVDGLLDAGRAAVLFGLGLLVLGLVFRTSLEDHEDELVEGWSAEGAVEMSVGSGRATAFFLGFLVLGLLLAVTCLMRRDWLPARLQQVRDVLAPPVVALCLFVAALPVAGVFGYLSLLTGDLPEDVETDELSWRQTIALYLAAISNVGLGYLGIGGGARIGGSYQAEYEGSGESESESDESWSRLATLVDEGEGMWGLWISIPLLLAVLALLAWFVVRRARGARPLASLLAWCGLMLVAFPWLARLASVHGSGEFRYDWEGEDARGSGSFFGGLPTADALLLALIGIGVALVVGALTGAINPRDVRRQLRSLQTYPGPGAATAPPGRPPGPPPSGPPPVAPPPAAPPPPGH